MDKYDHAYVVYKDLMGTVRRGEREDELADHRQYLAEDMVYSLDYHADCKRNGIPQPLLLTRGGEEHTYNVICRPGDQLYAGDIIDAFGQKWIVMEARADDTTHKTGIMQQCNHFMRWQNFSPEICSTWCYIRASGYSAYIGSDTQLQKSDEQMAIYLPYNEDTAKIFVDKRLPSHIGYDKFGNKILSAFRVTATNPVSPSYNDADHLMILKVERDMYSESTDNLDLMICDYIDGGTIPDESSSDAQHDCPCPDCPHKDDVVVDAATTVTIVGRDKPKIGKTYVYSAKIIDPDGNDITDGSIVSWSVEAPDDVNAVGDGNTIPVTIPKDYDLVGETIKLSVTYGDITATKIVEVAGLV